MCLIYVAYRVHPRFPLVVAANRDEFHARPSAPADWWDDAPELLAGRDLEAGGTWMGVTRGGRFAALTNYRDADRRDPGARSRGELVSEFLTADTAPLDYLAGVARAGSRYNGFSLLVGDRGELALYSNRGGPPAPVAPGVHGLSNHLMDTPWPKVEEGKLELLALLAKDVTDAQALRAPLLALLERREPAPDDTLPETGHGLERERAFSARFIVDPHYGTRCSTLVLFGADGSVSFQERSYDARGEARGDACHEFTIAEPLAAARS